MGRVCHLTNKIYREMLWIRTDERMRYITMGKSGIEPIDYIQYGSAFSCPPQYKIMLSWSLLAWISEEGRIPSSFTDFITTPELSGPLYLSSDIYHTQITEYLLWALSISTIEHLPHCYSARHFSFTGQSVWEHLSCALPTEKIFDQLRTISSEPLLNDFSTESLEIIVKWLQVSVSECNRQTPQTKNPLCV